MAEEEEIEEAPQEEPVREKGESLTRWEDEGGAVHPQQEEKSPLEDQ